MHTNDIITVRCTKHILMCETSGALELKLTILDFKKRKKENKKSVDNNNDTWYYIKVACWTQQKQKAKLATANQAKNLDN